MVSMKYYSLLINLFNPLIEDKPNDWNDSAFVDVVQQTPEEAVWSATVRLETLFRVYYLRHGFDAMDAYLLHFLNTLGFMAIRELESKERPQMSNDRRALLLMCALGLRDQGQYYHLVRAIFHLFRSKMGLEDLNLLKQYAQDEEAEKDQLYRPHDIVSQYPLDILGISNDPENHRVGNLVKETKKLSVNATSS
ncbi:MAG: hypothetical protein M1822_007318 [Bathelium mastoideum]|nr:MAG: hypothetical protein M1822_007318 [Bathelium mastoideum]